MSKHLQNLERLCKKMQQRYGDGDALVLQLKQEISSMEKIKARESAAMNFGRRPVEKMAAASAIH